MVDIVLELVMSRSGGSFPHPVLGYGDDVEAVFEISDVKQTSLTDRVFCQFRLRLDEPETRERIRAAELKLGVAWSCSATLQRGWIEPRLLTDMSHSQIYQFDLDQDEISGRVNCEVQLVASKYLGAYRLTRQHRSYGKFSFDIEPGDVVGLAGSFVLEANKLFDPMQPPVHSCFTIVQSDEVGGPVDFRLNFSLQEYVRIELSTEAFERFLTLRSHPDLQIAFVAFPALVATLAEMKVDVDGELTETDWHKSLTSLLKAANMVDASVAEQAQWLLANPVLSGLRDHAADEGQELD